MWERALRRAAVPVAVTEGFSPRPRLSFGLALSTGYESLAEYLDVDLAHGYRPDLDGWPALLSPALPAGIDVLAAVEVDRRAPSLQQDVTVASWNLELTGIDADATVQAVEVALAAATLVATRTRKGHEVVDDLRPGIVHLAVVGSAGGNTFVAADLATQPRSLRPAELVGAVFAGAEVGRIVRTHQWIDHDGARTEPIPLAVAPPAHLIGAGS
jgi:radical SAM-linked protein